MRKVTIAYDDAQRIEQVLHALSCFVYEISNRFGTSKPLSLCDDIDDARAPLTAAIGSHLN